MDRYRVLMCRERDLEEFLNRELSGCDMIEHISQSGRFVRVVVSGPPKTTPEEIMAALADAEEALADGDAEVNDNA